MRSTSRYGAVPVAALAAVLALGACSSSSDSVPSGVVLPTSYAVGPSRVDLGLGVSTPVEDPYYPDTSNPEVDALHYNLALSWDGTTLAGSASVTVRVTTATRSLRLDLAGSLHVSAVTMDGRPVRYEQVDDGLVMAVGPVSRGSQHTLVVDYAGSPSPVAAPSGRSDLEAGLGWSVDDDGDVYTFQEPYGAFTWFPVNDHPSDKALYDAQITVPRGSTAVFDGELVGHEPAGADATTWRWHVPQPTASYLTTIAIGPYAAVHQTLPGGTPATYWLLPRDLWLAPKLRSETPTAFRWLLEHAGDYPFSTFGVVLVGGYSGMETQTMVTLSRSTFDRPDAVLEHEIAHQWFGDAVTPTSWPGVWLNEGWAMWMQQAFERDTGRSMYAGGIAKWRPLDQAARERSGPPGSFRPASFGDVNVYLGPAMMLDGIRRRVGDQEFTSLTKAWVQDHEFGNVDRAEFVRWLNAETGQDLTDLVDRWLESPTTPR